MLRRLLLAASGAVLFSGAAVAQTPSVWTGCYVGIDGGVAIADQSARVTTDPGQDQFSPTKSNLDDTGVIGGGYGGCSMQLGGGPFVFGVEGDVSGADLDEKNTETNRFASGVPVGSGGITFERDLAFLATIRGRAGVSRGNLLFYATGGAAFAGLDYKGTNAFVGGCPNCGSKKVSNTEVGLVAGAGIDVALGQHWTIGSEYLFYHFDGESFDTFLQPNPTSNSGHFSFGDLDIHTIRARAGFRF